MPRPLRKIADKIHDARAAHRDRHRPTGYNFALADRIDFLQGEDWDEVTSGASFFMSRSYLRVLEDVGPDDVLSPLLRYL